jgi:hypothetical protein
VWRGEVVGARFGGAGVEGEGVVAQGGEVDCVAEFGGEVEEGEVQGGMVGCGHCCGCASGFWLGLVVLRVEVESVYVSIACCQYTGLGRAFHLLQSLTNLGHAGRRSSCVISRSQKWMK